MEPLSSCGVLKILQSGLMYHKLLSQTPWHFLISHQHALLYMCESFISLLYTLDFCPTVKYPGHSMSNMAPLNFVQDIFTSQRFMAERIKVVMKVVWKDPVRERTEQVSVGEKESKERWIEGGRGRKSYDQEGGCFPTPRMEKAATACTHKYTPRGIPTCDSGQRESQERAAVISNSVIWLC